MSSIERGDRIYLNKETMQVSHEDEIFFYGNVLYRGRLVAPAKIPKSVAYGRAKGKIDHNFKYPAK